jgi:transcriptional regulator with XRE-family HTH domain
VSSGARVSLGYLSEVERGQEEASSELLGSICEALDVPMWLVLREVSDRVAVTEGFTIPDTVPADLAMSALGAPSSSRELSDEVVRGLLREPSGERDASPEDLASVF